jgi:hypothetical protein
LSVIYYGEGDHPSGFVGYRVATTLGDCSEFRQQYFSLSEYSPAAAQARAEELNKKWRQEAEAAKRDSRLERKRPYGGPGVVVMGLRASLLVRRGRKDHHATSITPCFIVSNPGYGKGHTTFATTTVGVDAAFTAAVEHFCRIHALRSEEKATILSLQPSRDVFYDKLRFGLLQRGIPISEQEVKSKLTGMSVAS